MVKWIRRKVFEYVSRLFEADYGAYEYPFERADDKIMAMNQAARTEYFLQAKNLLENRAFQGEMQELIRTFYQELAIKSSGSDEAIAYRLTLKALQRFHKRFNDLAVQYNSPSVSKVLEHL